jgi:hypothetical protein
MFIFLIFLSLVLRVALFCGFRSFSLCVWFMSDTRTNIPVFSFRSIDNLYP